MLSRPSSRVLIGGSGLVVIGLHGVGIKKAPPAETGRAKGSEGDVFDIASGRPGARDPADGFRAGVRTREWSTQSGDLDRFGHAFCHGNFGVVGKLGRDHEVVPFLGVQILLVFLEDVEYVIHKSLAK